MRVLPTCRSRRSLLATTAAFAVAGPASLRAMGAGARPASFDPHRIAMLSDVHIPDEASKQILGVNPVACLRHVIEEVIATRERPSTLLINGDCALRRGEREDYAMFGEILEPLHRRNIPVHLSIGNHDDRESMMAGLGVFRPDALRRSQIDPGAKAGGRWVDIIEMERANLFVLDSLEKTNRTKGSLGMDQMRWLASALDERRRKPAIIVCHHNPDFGGLRMTGFRETELLFRMLAPRHHVKAFIYGHTHEWKLDTYRGIHLVNLPATSYVLGIGDPNGWVDAHLLPNGMSLTLNTHSHTDNRNGETHELRWR